MVRNCANQYKTSDWKNRVSIPFTIWALENYSEYEVLVSEDRRSLAIHSDSTPTFFNDNHVLSKMEITQRYLSLSSSVLFLMFRGLKESEIKELLPGELYQQLWTTFNQKKLESVLHNKDHKQSMATTQKKSRKRTHEMAALQWNEEVLGCFKSVIKQETPPVHRSLDIPWDTPKLHKRIKRGTSNQSDKDIFESWENRSSVSNSFAVDRHELPNSPFSRDCFSPARIRPNEFQVNISNLDQGGEEVLQTPSKDRFRNFWLPNLDSTNWKSSKYLRNRGTPLEKEQVNPFIQNTPLRDIRDCYENVSQGNDNSFISPKFKELSFGKDTLNCRPVVKTPLLKQFEENQYQASEFMDDDITKAEFSNLFSNK